MNSTIFSTVLVLCVAKVSLGANTMLLDFESDHDLAIWHDENRSLLGADKKLDRVSRFVTSGKYALRITIPAWRPDNHGGLFKWPAMEAKPPITDWSMYDRLVLDATNVTAEHQRLMMFISDSKRPTRSGLDLRMDLPPFGHVRTTLDLRAGFRKKKINPSDIHVMHIFTENPPVKMVVYLDAFQLLKPGEKPVRISNGYIHDFALMQKDSFAIVRQTVTSTFEKMVRKAAGAPSEVTWIRRELEAAMSRLNGFADSLRRPTPKVLNIPAQCSKIVKKIAGFNNLLDLALKFKKVRHLVMAPNSDRYDVIAGFATSMEKILPRRFKPVLTITDHPEVRLARNERESIQLVVIPRERSLEQASVRVTDLHSKTGVVFPANAINCVLMGYVQTKAAPRYDHQNYVGWWPDPILNFLHTADIRRGDAQSFWIRVYAPANQLPGLYNGKLTLMSAGKKLMTFRFTIRVYDFLIPKASPLPLAITFHPQDHPLAETRALQLKWRKLPDYPVNAWKKHRFEWADFLADYFITFDSLYPYNGAGAPQFDILDRLNKQGRLGCFNLGYYGPTPKEPAAAEKWKKDILAMMLPRYKRAKALGIIPHAYIYGCDEANRSIFPQVQRTAMILKQAFPGISIMTTARDPGYGLDSVVTAVDAWCPLTPSYNLKKAKAARAAGKQVWWYICCGPGHPYANMFIEFPAIEGRLLMGAMTAKYRPDGFLYYQISIWNSRHPIKKGPFTDWNPRSWTTFHGDGSWTCVGPGGTPLPTIRLENFRDGLEDYAYYRILEKRIAAVESDTGLRAKKGKWIERAKHLLKVPDDVVKSMSLATHDPAVLYRYRDALAEAIEAAYHVNE